MTYALECHALTKTYNGQPVLRDLTLRVRAGQLLALLGPSGCGKTTTLRLIAGFDWPDSGSIVINGRAVAGDGARVPPEARRVGMVFQEYALFPHHNVAGNVGFGLRGPRKAARVREMLALVGMEDYAARMPHELSGGQQQRVALARALAPAPEVLLLDEPFSNLDAALRAQVRAEVRGILKQAGITGVFVTHDQEEAFSLADVVAVMFDGRAAQVGEPQHLYHHPATPQVAAFVGEANFIPGQAEGDTAICALGRLPLHQPAWGPVDVLLRPEALRLDEAAAPDVAAARVTWREFYGHDQRVGLALDGGLQLVARVDSAQAFAPGQTVAVRVSGAALAYPRQA
ncbi:MAG: ABC transporter ATP-binding protein [Aggregatilineales bacterium]